MSLHPDDLPAYVEFLEGEVDRATDLISELSARVFGKVHILPPAYPLVPSPERIAQGRVRRQTFEWLEGHGAPSDA